MDLFYDRQNSLGLKTNQTILVIGAGGIGFHVTKMLIMSGVQELHLFDFDTIETHNLNRLDVSVSSIGKNKVDVLEEISMSLRPDCRFNGYPFEFQDYMLPDKKFDWLIDCTDKLDAQRYNQSIANKKNIRYVKAGYNGFSISINNRVASWGDTPDGYTIIPSFIAPAVIVSGLVVTKVLKPEMTEKEISTNVLNMLH